MNSKLIPTALWITLSLFGLAQGGEKPESKSARVTYLHTPEKVANWNVLDALNALAGKRVTLHLSNGTQIKGLLAPLRLNKSSNTVYLTELSGADYFGSIVQLNQIVGIEFRNQEP